MKSEISKIQKEGQDSRLDGLSDEYKKAIEAINRLQRDYNDMLENASTDYGEILIYGKYVNTLHELIYEIIIQLDCKDRKILALKNSADKSVTQTSATIQSDLKIENPEENPAIPAMDLTDKMFINRLDNKNETNDEPDDLRHHNSNDLQSTCRKYQHVEVNDLQIEKEAIKDESKRLNDGIQKSFIETYEVSVKDENIDLELRSQIVHHETEIKRLVDHNKELTEKNVKCEKRIKEYKNKFNNVQKVSATELLKTLDKPAYFIRQI
jgi:hypothetical protein